MQDREFTSSGTKWEDDFCYSRGVRVANHIFISGTTSVRNGEVIGRGNVEIQVRECLNIIKEAIEKLGGSLSDVVRTRMFVKDIKQSSIIGKVHSEFFKGINPAATMVEINHLINDDLLIEVEADAVIVI